MDREKELEETLARCVETLRTMGLTAREFVEQLNFILGKLGEMYSETK